MLTTSSEIMASLNVIQLIGLAFCLQISLTAAIDNFEGNDVIEGEFIVMFKDDLHQTMIKDVLKNANIQWTKKIKNAVYAFVKADKQYIIPLTQHRLVAAIEANRRVSLVRPVETKPHDRLDIPKNIRRKRSTSDACQYQEPGDTLHYWGLIRTSYRALPHYDSQPYLYSEDGTGVDAYILDTGVDIKNVEFGGRASYGMVAPSLASEGNGDYNGHGTNVAGITAGTKYGIAKGASIISCKVLNVNGSGTVADSVDGLNWVVAQVQQQKNAGKNPRSVINMSLGGSFPSVAQYMAIQSAVDEGITVVVAAGNDGIPADTTWPAAFNNTFTVGASDSKDYFASFSNYGSLVDIIAPGVTIYAACSTNSSLCTNAPPEQCTAYYSGTSQATPHVTGIIARYLSSLSDSELAGATPASIQSMIINTASLGYITYPDNTEEQSTPNRLLYKACGYTTTTESSSSYTTTTMTSLSSKVMSSITTTMAAVCTSFIILCKTNAFFQINLL